MNPKNRLKHFAWNDFEIVKSNWVTIALCVLGIFSFYLPWIYIEIFNKYGSLNGYTFPKMINFINDTYVVNKTDFSYYYFIYAIPFCFLIIGIVEFLEGNSLIQLCLLTVIMGCIMFFVLKIPSIYSFEQLFRNLGMGFYLTLILSPVLVVKILFKM